jgi:hypothetical protein
MWVAFAILLPLAAFAASCAIVRGARRRPAPLVAPLGLAVLVCYETVALHLLSVAGAVARPGVALVQLVPVILVVAMQPSSAWRWVRSSPRGIARSATRLGVPGLVIAPLVALLVLSSARYAPNNWDSMTYHLARVAHWIQNGSVAPYPTHVARQVLFGPGAEYLLLVLQLICWSDVLAGFVQLFCWLLLVWSAPSLARLAGTSLRTARWASVLVAGLPMGVLQASSTQNDLVSAVTCVALVAAATPFLHRSPGRWRAGDVSLLAAAGTASALVKPIALLVASPLLAVAAWRTMAGLARRRDRARAIGVLAGNAAVSALIVGSVALQGSRPDAGRLFSSYLFPVWGEWGAKAVNLAAGLAHHVPLPARAVEALGLDVERACRGSAWCARLPLSVYEDFAGNPAATAAGFGLVAIAASRWKALRPIARASTALTVLAWVVFHLAVRENLWVSRLQLPLFIVSIALLSAVPNGGRSGPRTVLLVAAVALVTLAHGYWAALRHATRPPISSPSWAGSRELSYYANDPGVRIRHNAALAVAELRACRRIGLLIREDSFDYPLTWRAMQKGIEVRHYFGADSWPCVVFTDRGRPPAPPGTPPWIPALGENVFVRGTAAP